MKGGPPYDSTRYGSEVGATALASEAAVAGRRTEPFCLLACCLALAALPVITSCSRP